jgi:hypothetical protein
VSRLNVELEGRYIKPPKLRREGKVVLSTIQLIGRLYVMRNAQDSENYSMDGPICSNKVRSAYVKGEGAEQEPTAVHRKRDHQTKSNMCPPKSDIAKQTILSKRS